MLDLLQYPFFINALVAAILSSISCGILGSYIVSRRLVFISGGISHASFGGVGLAYYLGFSPILGASLFSVLTSLGIYHLSRRHKLREDSLIGIFWSLGMAVGIIFIHLTPGYAVNLTAALFGDILTVSWTELWLLGGLAAVILALFIFLFKEIQIIAFDETFARSRGLPVDLISLVLMVLISLTIVFNIRIVGIILVMSLLTLPQATANLFCRRFSTMTRLSVALAVVDTILGLVVSFLLGIPSGAAIIFCAALVYGLSVLLVWTRKKFHAH
jgi:zinc transport system permease protein